MDKEKWNIRDSVEDAITILDSAPMPNDLSREYMLVRITNRAPIAHLAIERGLKYLYYQAGGDKKRTHDLPALYSLVKEKDAPSANYLAHAYNEIISFFQFDLGDKQYLRSLDTYFGATGTGKVFERMRYWTLEHKVIPSLDLTIHREILYALGRLLLDDTEETVVTRVERCITQALWYDHSFSYSSDDVERREAINGYYRWLFGTHTSGRHVLKEAVDANFAVHGADEFAMQHVRKSYDSLQETKDVAVRYYLITLRYLPRDSQPQFDGPRPGLQFNVEKTFVSIDTPAKYPIGYAEQRHDGSWQVCPHSEENVIAEDQADAVNYVCNASTRKVVVRVLDEQRVLHLVTDFDFFHSDTHIVFVGDDADVAAIDFDALASYKLEFWDSEHGLEVGDAIEAVMHRRQGVASCLKGHVSEVNGHKVIVQGLDRLDYDDSMVN